MPKDNDKNQFIKDSMLSAGVKKETIRFYIFFLQYFVGDNDGSVPMISTSKKLAKDFGKSDRTIRRYMNELKDDFSYIRIQPHFNNSNPDKPYIEYNIYHLLNDSVELISKAESYSMRNRNVFFEREKLVHE